MHDSCACVYYLPTLTNAHTVAIGGVIVSIPMAYLRLLDGSCCEVVYIQYRLSVLSFASVARKVVSPSREDNVRG